MSTFTALHRRTFWVERILTATSLAELFAD